MNTPAISFIPMRDHVYQGIVSLAIGMNKFVSTKVVYCCIDFGSEM